MKTLYILRHAKSSWTDPTLADFDRPLNERGLRTAPFMGQLMKEHGVSPDVVISSPAVRAAETASAVIKAGDFDRAARLDHRIYEASPHTLAQVVSEIDENCDSAMIVGHNPGMEGLIRYLTGRLESMPTAALAVVDLDIPRWSSVADGCGEVRRVYRPKEEMK
jgi:phosphohistidine phosphatase